jgi:hypothetical protein
MQPLQGSRWLCALALLGAVAGQGRAAWCDVFQTCCHCCDKPVVAGCCAPVQTTYIVQRTCYEPAPCCHCGPIKRLLGLCHCCKRPCCPPRTAVVVPPVAMPCPVPGVPIAPLPAAPVPSAYLPAVPSSPAPPLIPGPSAPEPGGNPAAPPPVAGSPSGSVRPLAPVRPQVLTPPRSSPPIRLDRFVNETTRRAGTPAILVGESPPKTP